jgi:hypothetical protein
MQITNGTVSAEVEYTNHEDGTWSFRLTFEDDPVPIESMGTFPTKELAEEQVNYRTSGGVLAKTRRGEVATTGPSWQVKIAAKKLCPYLCPLPASKGYYGLATAPG